MPLANYAQLQQKIIDYLEQDDVSGHVADFIRIFESRASRELAVREMGKVQTGYLTAATQPLPVDYVSTEVWLVTSSTPYTVAEYVPQKRFLSMAAATTGGGAPRAYTIIGTNTHWAPNPAGAGATDYPFTHYYLSTIPALAINNPTNWLLNKAPEIYLYGSLLEAEPFLVNDERVDLWAKLYQQAVTSLQSVDARAKARPGGIMRPEVTTMDGKRWMGAY